MRDLEVWAIDRACHLPVGVRQEMLGQVAAYKARYSGDQCFQGSILFF
jgi:hypothetical protein